MAKVNKTDRKSDGKSTSSVNIKWNEIFDAIWGITFTGYPERRKSLETEFKRIGILDSGIFNWRFTYPSIFDNILFDVTKKQLRHNDCPNVPVMSCLFGHYGCIKTSYELGHEFILIMEDDIRFLKNVSRIKEIIEKIPPCADIVNFDALPSGPRWNREKYVRFVEDNSYNEEFYASHGMMGAACYALSRKAMKAICIRCEQMLLPFDIYTSGDVYLGSDISKYASNESLCCQLTYGKSMNVSNFGSDSLHSPYSRKALDYSKYNIFDLKGYTYGCSV